MNPSTLADLDREYEAWEEAEAMHAHVMSVHDILDTLDPDRADHAAEWKYQQQRLQHSPTYFSGSMFYRGERLFGSPTAAGKSTQPKRNRRYRVGEMGCCVDADVQLPHAQGRWCRVKCEHHTALQPWRIPTLQNFAEVCRCQQIAFSDHCRILQRLQVSANCVFRPLQNFAEVAGVSKLRFQTTAEFCRGCRCQQIAFSDHCRILQRLQVSANCVFRPLQNFAEVHVCHTRTNGVQVHLYRPRVVRLCGLEKGEIWCRRRGTCG